MTLFTEEIGIEKLQKFFFGGRVLESKGGLASKSPSFYGSLQNNKIF